MSRKAIVPLLLALAACGSSREKVNRAASECRAYGFAELAEHLACIKRHGVTIKNCGGVLCNTVTLAPGETDPLYSQTDATCRVETPRCGRVLEQSGKYLAPDRDEMGMSEITCRVSCRIFVPREHTEEITYRIKAQ